MDMALQLVNQVHTTLGQHRADDSLRRTGWLSGKSFQHPTAGGLRIGKRLPERGPNDPGDRATEWDRDGQYLHYLTQWMHALYRVSQEFKSQPLEAREYLRYATELAKVVHAKFTTHSTVGAGAGAGVAAADEAPPRMVWKLNCYLTRVLVPSQGAPDPLDALVTYLELRTQCECLTASWNAAAATEQHEQDQAQAPAQAHEPAAEGERQAEELKDAVEQSLDASGALDLQTLGGKVCLDAEIREAEEMVANSPLETTDALGIGGLLCCTFRLARLISRHHVQEKRLLARLIPACKTSLASYARSCELSQPAASRLAFRELGLSIGLQAIGCIDPASLSSGTKYALEQLSPYRNMSDRIIEFWLSQENRQQSSWNEHADINEVMLATALVPAGYLGEWDRVVL